MGNPLAFVMDAGTAPEELSSESGPEYQLGYLEPVEQGHNPNLTSRFFFPSKAGGVPAWMDPSNVPSRLMCGQCESQLCFLCQLYAPLQAHDLALRPEVFHRMLYVFACNSAACVRAGAVKNGSVRVLRCQLPRSNKFYSQNALDPEEALPHIDQPSHWAADQLPEHMLLHDSEPESSSEDSEDDDEDTQR